MPTVRPFPYLPWRPLMHLAIAVFLWTGAQPGFAAETHTAAINATMGRWVQIAVGADGVGCQGLVLSELTLQLDGFNTGLHPTGCFPQAMPAAIGAVEKTAERATLSFLLTPRHASKSTSTDMAWSGILGNPWEGSEPGFVRSFQASIVKSDGSLLPGRQTMRLTLLAPARLAIAATLIAIVWLAILAAANKSGILRDARSVGAGLDRPFSLARVQMAWWFALTIGAFIFLWALTDEWAQLNPSLLALLGISSVTTATAVGIDVNAGTPMPRTEGFFRDILTDANGVTLARLQHLLWTFVMGVVFIYRVFSDLSMPSIDTATLGLLGLSAGTYVGFKLPEKHQNDSAAGVGGDTDIKAGYTPL